MNISYNWLNDYIQTNLSVGDLTGILTDLGLEVESVDKYEEVKGGLAGLVTGEVLACSRHPNADKLSLTTVNIGADQPLHIVCGAPNVTDGQKVVVAPVGTTLYKGNEPFTLQKVKIRGELSEGMICAEDEIGLGESHEGIMVLPADTPVGLPAAQYFDIYTDTVIGIGLTPNRIDAASHLGVARDLYAFLKQTGIATLRKPDVSSFGPDEVSSTFAVSIEDTEGCPRYAGLHIEGVKVTESPAWLKNRLKSIGVSSINNIVDITNYVLHEYGQPLHAFDANKLAGNKIIVKRLPGGTRFITLDGIEHTLSDEDLMICDASKPVAIGGVFGGLFSGITEDTTTVFLESAYFKPSFIRRTARRLGISTDSSFRFERGADPQNTLVALKRAAMLIKELAGGRIVSDIIDVYPTPVVPVEVNISFPNVDRLIGKQIDRDHIRQILKSLDMEILSQDNNGMQITVPPYRADVTREADVIEEILRIYGYNNVEISEELYASVSYTPKPDNEKLINLVSDQLAALGFNEIMCNSLTKSVWYDALTTFNPDNLVKILNPLSNDLNVMRQTLLFGALETVAFNTNRKNPNLKLFEFGKCYTYNRAKEKPSLADYTESRYLALTLTGQFSEDDWQGPGKRASFFDLKGCVENLLGRLSARDFDLLPLVGFTDIYSDGLSLYSQNQSLGTFGIVGPDILNRFEINNEVLFAEINWDMLLKLVAGNSETYCELPKYPEVRRDLSMLLNKAITYEQLEKLAYKTEKRLLKRVTLFDVYEGENIEAGKKSYALAYILQDESKTLIDKEIDQVMQRLVSAYEKEFGARVRQ